MRTYVDSSQQSSSLDCGFVVCTSWFVAGDGDQAVLFDMGFEVRTAAAGMLSTVIHTQHHSVVQTWAAGDRALITPIQEHKKYMQFRHADKWSYHSQYVHTCICIHIYSSLTFTPIHAKNEGKNMWNILLWLWKKSLLLTMAAFICSKIKEKQYYFEILLQFKMTVCYLKIY